MLKKWEWKEGIRQQSALSHILLLDLFKMMEEFMKNMKIPCFLLLSNLVASTENQNVWCDSSK